MNLTKLPLQLITPDFHVYKIFSPLSINRKEPNLGLQDHRGRAEDSGDTAGHI